MKKTICLLLTVLGCVGVVSCSDNAALSASANTAKADNANLPWEQPVPKATCAANDVIEPGLQGQVTQLERANGFKGTHCNLELVGQWAGEGASWQHAWFDDCAYYDQANATGSGSTVGRPALLHPGTVVIDASDSAHPVATDYLATTAMLDPWESLKVNEKRKLLAAVNGTGGSGGPEFDVYDISQDCKHPKLLSSTTMSNASILGHEGNWAPDGMTYYGADNTASVYYAIDVSNPAAPKQLLEWKPPTGGIHGLSLNADGTRGYFVNTGNVIPSTDPAAVSTNGFFVLDTSEVQARKPNPQIKIISSFVWKDGAEAQHTIPIAIAGHPYLIHVDELGSGGLGSPPTWASACAQGLPPYGFARIFDLGDETKPALVAKMMLQTHDPANCNDVIGDTSDEAPFGYDSHYCTVDDQTNASILACGYFNSGLRVFDIRDPYKPKEIAYYNPPAKPGYQAGSNFNLSGVCTTADWASSMPRIRKDKNEIWFTSHCNGFQVVKFTKPLADLMGPAPAGGPVVATPVLGTGAAQRGNFGGAFGLSLLLPLLASARRRHWRLPSNTAV